MGQQKIIRNARQEDINTRSSSNSTLTSGKKIFHYRNNSRSLVKFSEIIKAYRAFKQFQLLEAVLYSWFIACLTFSTIKYFIVFSLSEEFLQYINYIVSDLIIKKTFLCWFVIPSYNALPLNILRSSF